jgi:hypothetical protein
MSLQRASIPTENRSIDGSGASFKSPDASGDLLDMSPFHRVGLAEGMTMYVGPRKVEQWDVFRTTYPERSIALDGFVYGKPNYDPEGVYLNANHHEDVDRLATRSTASQVYIALKQGLMDAFTVDGSLKMNIFVNDPDQDTCLSVWLLKNHERILGARSEPLINRLVDLEDRFDVTAGAYPMNPTDGVLQQLAWMFEPYTEARLNGRVSQMDGAEMASVIESVSNRISAYSLGEGQKLPPDTRYKTLGGGDNWAMIEEIGAQARTALFASGVKAFVSCRFNSDSSMTYSVGRMSPYVRFPIAELYDVLNAAEGISPDDPNRWGGSDIIGGSPRATGSRLRPEEVQAIINRYLHPGVLTQ